MESKEIKKLTEQLKDAQKNLKDLNKSFESMGLLMKQTAALKKNTQAKKDSDEEEDKTKENVAEFAQQAAAVLENIGSAANKIRENRDDFTSLNPAIKATGAVAGAMGSATGKFIGAAGDLIDGASWFFGPEAKIVGAVVGTGLRWLGDALDKNSKIAAQMAAQFGEFATGEMQRVFGAFQTMGKVGALGAEGMTSLYDNAIKANLDVGTYSKIISANGPNMALLGNVTEKGVKQLSQVDEETKALKDKYLALGQSYEETEDLQIKGIERARMLGMAQANDVKSLAAASEEYVDQVNEVSRLTGLSRQQANSLMEKQLANTRFSVVMAEQTEKTGSAISAKGMSNAVSYFSGRGGERLGTAMMDAFAGSNSPAAKELSYVTNGLSNVLVEQYKAGEIGEAQFVQKMDEALRSTYESRGSDAWLATVGTGGSLAQYNQIVGEARRVVKGGKITEKAYNENKDAIQENKEAKDQATADLVDGQKALRDLSLDFDRIVKDHVFPNATKVVDNFADMLDNFISKATGRESTRHKQPLPPAGNQGPPEGAGGTASGEGLAGKGLSGVDSALAQRLSKAAADYFAATGKKVTVTSAVRTPEEQQKLYQDYISGKSKYPAARPGHSKHDRGMAVDVNSSDAAALASMGLLAKYGLGRPVANDPVHIEVVSAATGGAFSGPRSGYPAVLHGNEAVVPLPNGKSIPVESSSGGTDNSEVTSMLVEQNAIIDRMIYAAKQTNVSNKKLVALKAN